MSSPCALAGQKPTAALALRNTIEPGTKFATMVRERAFTPLDDDAAADLFTLTRERTRAAGLAAYEISNHARPGEESRHNLAYWRYDDYCGIGPGAHGRRGGQATLRHKKPENWLSAVARKGDGLAEESKLAPEERAREALVMGLRLREGVDLAAMAVRTGASFDRLIDQGAAKRLESLGLIRRNGAWMTVTDTGMPLLDRVLVEIVAI